MLSDEWNEAKADYLKSDWIISYKPFLIRSRNSKGSPCHSWDRVMFMQKPIIYHTKPFSLSKSKRAPRLG